MSYLVCIPTAGTGSRLEGLTKYLNKSLVSIGHRPGICHIIDKFPAETTFVIAIGHQGHLVKEFLSLAYPNHKFIFVNVDPFEGPGSGLGTSLLSCREHLQAPFIFCSCDTITTTPIPAPDHNWMAFADVDDLAPYRTLSVVDGKVARICEKNEVAPNRKAYIGLAGIKDHKIFWERMTDGSAEQTLTGESHGMRALVSLGIKAYAFDWLDTGNLTALTKARESFKKPDDPNILDKPNEAIWFVNNTVIKFSADTEFIRKRVARAKVIHTHCPPILRSTAHMYQYPMIQGDVLSNVVTLPLFAKLLAESEKFWVRRQLSADEMKAFEKACFAFYHNKTKERVELFYKTTNHTDGTESINGKAMPTLASLLDKLDWHGLAQGLAGHFHGDFHFENILYNAKEDKFTFLDWRQDFGGNLETGDIYYDLAKLYHGLIISHELITKDRYSIDWKTDRINCSFERKQILEDCEKAFLSFLKTNGYDTKRVKILTALIFLNIAALHHHPYRELLYTLGKDMLADILM